MDAEHCRTLVERCPAMVWQAGPDGRRTWFNPAWCGFTGRSLAEEVGDGWLAGVHPDDLPRYRESIRQSVEQWEPFGVEYRLRRSDGTFRAVFDRGAPYEEAGSPAGFVGVCADLRDPRETPDAFLVDELFELSLDNLCVAGLDGYFKRLNPSWTRTLGWTAEELMSRPSVTFVHPDDRDATLAGRGRLRVGAPLGPLVNRYLCKDGSYRWFEWRSVSHLDRGLVYAAARDITEQKLDAERLRQATELQEKLQRQLLFADRMASVGTLAAGVAHEINNPLSYVTANIALILEKLALPAAAESVAELREMAVEIQEGAERIRKIVRGLQTFSREEERRSVIDVRPVLDLAVDMTRNEVRQRARLIEDYGSTPLVEADPARLGQVFIHLLLNATQAIPEGDRAGNEIHLTTSTDAEGRAVIEVRDTGAGIPASVIGRVFDPFFTTKPVGVGTGLGLSISLNIVHGLGGEILVTSEPGRGTTFRVVLPAADPVPGGAPKRPTGGDAIRVATVLVVDDEPAVGAVLRRILGSHDVTVVTAATTALDLLAAGRRFDVIFSDLMMSAMSGMEFYDRLTRDFPADAARVVFISGGAFTPAANAFLDRVPNERIRKPFDLRHVRDVVQRFVGWRDRGR